MSRAELRLWVGAILAVIVPVAVMELAINDARRDADLTAAPFAWRPILLAHLAAALPLGLAVAARVGPLSAPRWVLVALGIAAAAGVGAASPGIAHVIVQIGAGAIPLLLFRTLVAFALVLPWCLAAIDPPATDRPPFPFGAAFSLGLALAIIPCALYGEAVLVGRTTEANALYAQSRLLRAERVVTGLSELGSDRPVGERPPIKMRNHLTSTLASLRREAQQPMSDSPSSVDRIDRAILLVKLERLGEAADLLQPLVPNDDRATQMLAAIYTDLKRGAESDPLYASVLEKFLPRAPTDRGAAAACKAAFAGLADNARLAHRPAEVEAVLSRGLRELPAEAAHFHFLLGRHYHDAGRYGLATEHLNEATRLDSTSFGTPADELLRQIRTSTPGCFAGGHR